ncbi:hypothetical protein [Nitrososphaera viennensis]|uniref:hypothetical protein n=1 Tax=Nitrososphaera viennensis TaxID=1034015 RepID=UPI0021B05D29|nr:hypothetical protein [Nitrososphaera viennensis]
MAAEESAMSNNTATSIFGLPSTIDIFGVQVTPFAIILTIAIIVYASRNMYAVAAPTSCM